MTYEKLDQDLKSSKSNSIKESIRRGHDELGDYYLECGDLPNALKCFSRARDYCSTQHHVIGSCINVIQVSLYLKNWPNIISYVSKVEHLSEYVESCKDFSNSNNSVPMSSKDVYTIGVISKIKCAAGLAEMAQKKYKSAAKSFFQVCLII